MEVNMKIPQIGGAIGTVGWVAQKLSQGKVVLKYSTKNVPGLYFVDGDKLRFIVEPITGYEDQMLQRTITTKNGDASASYPKAEDYKEGFWNAPLTPAAEQATEDFIMKVAEKFMEQWENDKIEDHE